MNDEELRLLFAAWLAKRDGLGLVLADDAYPAADGLAERGWLHRHIEDDGEMSWHWTQQAEAALMTGALLTSAMDRQN